MKPVDRRRFTNRETLAHALAAAVAERLEAAIDTRGQAVLVVSGGRTPERLFEVLSGARVAWAKVTVTLADERWVAADDPASNEALVRRTLLRNRAAEAHFVGLKTAADRPEAGEAECQQRLAALPRPFDVVLLGLGTDGHTASWFPDARELGAALEPEPGRLCAAVNPAGQPPARMTLTHPALADARWLALHIEGEDKQRTLDELLAGDDIRAMPARALWLDRERPPVVYWAP